MILHRGRGTSTHVSAYCMYMSSLVCRLSSVSPQLPRYMSCTQDTMYSVGFMGLSVHDLGVVVYSLSQHTAPLSCCSFIVQCRSTFVQRQQYGLRALALALAALYRWQRGNVHTCIFSFRFFDFHCYPVVFLEREEKMRNGYLAGRFSGRWRHPPGVEMPLTYNICLQPFEVLPTSGVRYPPPLHSHVAPHHR